MKWTKSCMKVKLSLMANLLVFSYPLYSPIIMISYVYDISYTLLINSKIVLNI